MRGTRWPGDLENPLKSDRGIARKANALTRAANPLATPLASARYGTHELSPIRYAARFRRGPQVSLRDRTRPTECRDLGVRETELRHHFVGVLSKQRRAPTDVGRRGVHLDRRAERPQMAERGMLDLDDHVARDDLRIGEHLRVIVDRP